ncbi:MAG: hypothetical protein HQK81_05650 [Desulfovibrionaceae bacterium]|nr:hypothetical protein [Desulfovibrionaceae bacterium]MBF0513533.1 hypothetical protein [Desulfovibrionaceae bacterium]
MKSIVFTAALVCWAALAQAQGIDDATAIHQCKIKGFHPGMSRHDKVRLLGDRYGDAALAKDACYRSEAEFAQLYNLDAGEAKSLYAPECRAEAVELVLERAEVQRVFGEAAKDPGEFARELAFAFGVYFQFDAQAGSYEYANAKDKCALTVDKDLRLILSRPAALGKEQGKK